MSGMEISVAIGCVAYIVLAVITWAEGRGLSWWARGFLAIHWPITWVMVFAMMMFGGLDGEV